MPYYDYRCLVCKSRFESKRPMAQRDAPIECPTCRGTKSVRLISLPVAFSQSADGSVNVVGGSACGGCSATSCGGCASSR